MEAFCIRGGATGMVGFHVVAIVVFDASCDAVSQEPLWLHQSRPGRPLL